MAGIAPYQLSLAPESARWFIAATFGPAEALLIGLAAGYGLVRVGRHHGYLGALLVASSAYVSAAAFWYFSIADTGALASFPPFADFAALVGGTGIPSSFGGSPSLGASAFLITLYEAAFISAAGLEVIAARSGSAPYAGEPGLPQLPPKSVSVPAPVLPSRGVPLTSGGGQAVLVKQAHPSSMSSLGADERTVLELFLFNQVRRLEPKVDLHKPEGLSFQEMPGVRWDAGRLLGALDSLTRKGYLRASLLEKLHVCRSCGSAALLLSSGCPECGSVNLTRHPVIEHFRCGLIEKEEAFLAPAGQLVCPKCKGTLSMVGSDYRNLSPMYICQDCNAMNLDLAKVMNCSSCGAKSPVEEQDVRPIYSYQLNEEKAEALRKVVKPIGTFASHYRSRGYEVVSPAMIVGRSGARHTFDFMIRVPESAPGRSPDPGPQEGATAGGTAVEIMISSGPSGVDKIAAVYGKVSDVDCPSAVFVIPSLTESARSYASRSSLTVFEGETPEAALAKSESWSPGPDAGAALPELPPAGLVGPRRADRDTREP